jgi:hypothetical protein
VAEQKTSASYGGTKSAAAPVLSTLAELEQRIAEKQRGQQGSSEDSDPSGAAGQKTRASSGGSNSTAAAGASALSTLAELERRITDRRGKKGLAAVDSGPSAAAPVGVHTNKLLRHDLDPTTTERYDEEEEDGAMNNHNNLARAEMVHDDAEKRERIARQAQETLLAKAVSARVIDTDDDERKNQLSHRRCLLAILAVLVGLLLLAAAVVVGVFCGDGKCSSSSSSSSSTTLTKSKTGAEIAALINSVSLHVQETGETIPLASGITPEAQALAHLIDSSSFAVVGNRGGSVEDWQYIQRYALLTFWFTNGPWGLSSSSSSSSNGTMVDAPAAPTATWLVGFDDCKWAGVECHDNDGRVTMLRLEDVGLSGTVLPRDLGLLTALHDLHLKYSFRLNITIAATLKVLRPLSSTLRSLDLSFSACRGTIPAEDLAALTTLTALRLLSNALTGTLPDDVALWSSLASLRALDLSFNSDLGGTIPAALTASLTSLTQLSLGFSGFIAPLPNQDELKQMPDLVSLSLGHLFADAAPDMTNLSGLSKLTQLELATSAVSQGSIPSDVVDWWPAMAHLSLYGGLTGTIPSSLARWTSLRHFLVNVNMLTGSIPTELFAAWSGSLTVFSASRNDLGGTLPEQIGLWSNLELLLLDHNDFSGPLPTAIGSLTDLKIVSLEGNRLSGTIPVAVLNWTNADLVSLEGNNFTGVAPYCTAAADDIIVPKDLRGDCLVCPCCKECS